MAKVSLTTSAYVLLATGPIIADVDLQTAGSVKLVVASSLPAMNETNFMTINGSDEPRRVALEAGEKLYGLSDRALDVVVETSVGIPLLPLPQTTFAATITSGSSLSGAIDLGVYRAVRLATPAGWDAAVLTFQVSYDGTTWAELYDEAGNAVSYTLVAGKSMRLPVADWIGIRHFKIRSGTLAAAVNQTADRAFVVVAQ